MPGYADGERDVAGFIVGVVARDRLIDGGPFGPAMRWWVAVLPGSTRADTACPSDCV
jgi:hypothetical protein